MTALPVISKFLRQLGESFGARAASMLLHLEGAAPEEALLLHESLRGQTVQPLPEMANVVTALQFLALHNETNSLVLRSADDAGVLLLLRINEPWRHEESRRREDNERRRDPDVIFSPDLRGVVILGFIHDDADTIVAALDTSGRASEKFSIAQLALALAWTVYQQSLSLQDPITHLPGRMEFDVLVQRALELTRRQAQALGVLLLNPDDFARINHRLGRDNGDRVLREIADAVRASTRATDAVFRYAGAVFAIVLVNADPDQSGLVAEKMRRELSTRVFLNGAVRLSFTLGGAALTADDRESTAATLVSRAERALHVAKLTGGGRGIVAPMGQEDPIAGEVDPLTSIFTADTEKDYRNMMLLWETVSLISQQQDLELMAEAFVQRLLSAFRPERVSLLRLADDSAELHLLGQSTRDSAAASSDLQRSVRSTDSAAGEGGQTKALLLNNSQRELIKRACAERRIERSDQAGGGRNRCYAIPLLVGARPLGCLFVEAGRLTGELDSADLAFLNALAAQLAVAMDRATLAARWLQNKEDEGRRMKRELRELRAALSQAKFVYQSPEMHAVLETLRRIAPTDATVLILGESGTGKEMLARTLHELSDRKDKPFVTVDCGAIANSLIEAELFGHIKGAFTGAESASEGRIVMADGGTIFLDEVGELPLAMQTKLLRFVQEKEITAVGSSKSRRVNTRIVAATNRNLAAEVVQGTFREDLYHRLRVITIRSLPLRERPSDILTLAHFFLERFSTQYSIGLRQLTSDAEQRLLSYSWPGNVRELQHAMLRCVLMSDQELIDAAQIEALAAIETVPARAAAGPAQRVADVAPSAVLSDDVFSQPAFPSPESSRLGRSTQASAWTRLKQELERQVADALRAGRSRPVPIGRWLNDDVVLAASRASDDVARRAARLMGVPETTFRRQYDRVKADVDAGLVARTQGWSSMLPLIEEVIAQAGDASDDDLLERLRGVLLEVAVQHTEGRTGLGAAVMGVTPPTYKRWLEERSSAPPPGLH